MISKEVVYEVEQQFLKLLSAKGFNIKYVRFDDSTPLYISVMYCCKYLFIINYSKLKDPNTWDRYKLDLVNSVVINGLCVNHPNGKMVCAFCANKI